MTFTICSTQLHQPDEVACARAREQHNSRQPYAGARAFHDFILRMQKIKTMSLIILNYISK
jgi:hypothetical protein